MINYYPSLNELYRLENGSTIEQVLTRYMGATSHDDLINLIKSNENDTIGYWAECNKITESEMTDYIINSLNEQSNFKVIREEGSGGGWPECEIRFNAITPFTENEIMKEIVLGMDWVTE